MKPTHTVLVERVSLKGYSIKKLILGFALLMSSVIFAFDIRNCYERESEIIRQAVQDSHNVRREVIASIDETLQNEDLSISKKNIKKLNKAKYILKCAGIRTEDLKFNCTGDIGKSFMEVFPIFGNNVDVASHRLYRNNYDFIVGTIIHEATHNCGTNDSEYFFQSGKKPHSNWNSEWNNIASTYDYWAIKGFCIPEVDC